MMRVGKKEERKEKKKKKTREGKRMIIENHV